MPNTYQRLMMMNKYPYRLLKGFSATIVFVFVAHAINGQITLLQIDSIILSTQVDLSKDFLSHADEKPLHLAIKQGELSIKFPLPGNGEAQFFRIQPSFLLDGLPVHVLDHHIVGKREIRASPKKSSSELKWIELVDHYPFLNGELDVSVIIETWGQCQMPWGADCTDPEPSFSSREKLPHWIAAGVGISAITIGQLFKSSSNDIYNNQYLNAQNFDEAQPHYEEANSKRHTYLNLTYAGIILLGIDGVTYVVRHIITKNRKKIYHSAEYRRRRSQIRQISITPEINLGTNSTSTQFIGFSMIVQW